MDGEQLGGKGNVIVDRGLAGAPISAQLQNGYEAVLAKYPDIKIVGYYNGDYALGPEQSGVAALLAANPQVDGILTQGYGSGAMQALKDAGRPIVPVTGFSYNGSAVACAQTEGAKCILGANPAWLSSEAIKLAVDILDTGQKPAERATVVRADFITTDPFTSKLYPNAKMQKIELGKTAFPDLPPAPDAADHPRLGRDHRGGSRRRQLSAATDLPRPPGREGPAREAATHGSDRSLRALEALRRHRRPRATPASPPAPARCTRSSARTAPASRTFIQILAGAIRHDAGAILARRRALPPGEPRRGAGRAASPRSSRSCR